MSRQRAFAELYGPPAVPQAGAPLLREDARVTKPWKRTTTTSKAAIRQFRDAGDAEALRKRCIAGLQAIWNRTQQWATADELAAYLYAKGRIPDPHRDHVSPRLYELADGWWIVRKVHRQTVKRRIGGGVLERGEKRKSNRTGRVVMTWRVREAGSKEPPRGEVRTDGRR